ncbi:MAG TPA: DUF503 domain-containing protein [Vulgatibacter sp.]|nr:DUF503 domain-containing protein [Vulgatibacter sp.]
MIVGALRLTLQIPGAGSLKAKRHTLRKVIDRIRARFDVSVAEVADNELWQKATIGVAAVGNDRAFVSEVLQKVLRSVDESGVEAWVVAHRVELFPVGDGFSLGEGIGGGERTLAEAEAAGGGVDLELFVGEELPTLEELEAAAEAELSAPPPPPGRKRRR